MDPIPADQKLITEHPELVDPISGVIPPVPQAPASAPAEPDQDSTLPTEEEEEPDSSQEAPQAAPAARTATRSAAGRRQAHPAPRSRQAAQDRSERVRGAIPKGAKRAAKKR